MAYHTALWSEDLDQMFIFGGLQWAATDLVDTDSRRDRDRRCMKEAKDMPALFRDQDIFRTTCEGPEGCQSLLR